MVVEKVIEAISTGELASTNGVADKDSSSVIKLVTEVTEALFSLPVLNLSNDNVTVRILCQFGVHVMLIFKLTFLHRICWEVMEHYFLAWTPFHK